MIIMTRLKTTHMFHHSVLEVGPPLDAVLLFGVEDMGGRVGSRACLELRLKVLAQHLPLDQLWRRETLQ